MDQVNLKVKKNPKNNGLKKDHFNLIPIFNYHAMTIQSSVYLLNISLYTILKFKILRKQMSKHLELTSEIFYS